MKPNKNFTLDVDDIDMIETALSHQLNKLSVRRLTHVQSTIIPEDQLESVKEIDKEIHRIRDLLARLYHQKVWYRPKDKFVGGG
jgi:hypothetical protein